MNKQEIIDKIQFDRVQKKWMIWILLIYIGIIIGFFKMKNILLFIALLVAGNVGIALIFNLISYKKFGEFCIFP